MWLGNKIVVVLPAYNAARTLEQTHREIPVDIVDEVVLVDDRSADDTLAIATALGVKHVIKHDHNRGYGGNQKTCFDKALDLGADIVVILHPDYQYTPKLIRPMVGVLVEDVYDIVLGSRILGNGALVGGMPIYKYVANRALTLFDNQVLVQAHALGCRIAELTCPTRYFAEASSIGFRQSLRYGILCCTTAVQYRLHRMGLVPSPLFQRNGSALDIPLPEASRR